MKKYKKLIALAVAVLTLSATTITASAANFFIRPWDNKINLDSVEAEYYRANNVINYTELQEQTSNIITFSKVSDELMEGNVVLTVDFRDPGSSSRRISDEMRTKRRYYMMDLVLLDANGKFITEGKYPLTVSQNAPSGCWNVIVDTNRRVFNKLDIAFAYIENTSKPDVKEVTIAYDINDIYVLPSYIVKYGDKELTIDSNILSTPETRTRGWLTFELSKEEFGTKDLTFNGMKVATVTVSSDGKKISYKNQ